jgi:integrase
VTDSIRREKNLFHLWINPVIGDKPLRKIDILDLERIKKRMSDASRSARTVQYCLAVIRQVFNLARALGIYQGDNPVSKVKKPSVDNRRLRFLTREEADLLLAELKKRSQQLHDIALLSLHTGMRAGEIFNLTWDCIDFEQEQILIKDPKNKSNRYAFMTTEVKEMLERRYQGQLNGLVFTDRKGNKIKEVSNSFARAVKEIGLNEGIEDKRQKVVFHTLSHTYASWLVENGTDLYTVKELMGHKTLAMTERYSHLGQNTLKQAVQRLNKAINRPKGKILEFQRAINE